VFEQLLAEQVIARGLAERGRVEGLVQRAAAEDRPLELVLLEERIVDRTGLEAVLANLWSAQPGSRVTVDSEGGFSLSWDLDELPGSSAEVTDLRPGEVLVLRPGREVVVRGELGRGGMGVVYLVMDPALRRLAAVKLIRAGGDERRRVARFVREAVITARLDHPGIPPVYEAERTPEGRPYLLMRFLPGRSLGVRLRELHREGYPSVEDLRPILGDLVRVCETVAYAHSRGVVHRDLKPDNVVLGTFGEVCVVDWGLGRDLRQTASEDAALRADLGAGERLGDGRLTQDGATLGTAGFMAPEQAKGRDVAPTADVFSLGAILSVVLTGSPPFEGRTALEVLAQTGEGAVTYPDERRADLPPDLAAIARAALAPDLPGRYLSARALGEDLAAFLAGRRVSVHRYRPWEETWRLVRSHPALFAALAVALVGSTLGVGVIYEVRQRAAQAAQEAQVADAAADAAASAARFAQSEGARERLAAALAARSAAQRWHALAPAAGDALEARAAAALHLGEVAMEAQQYPLAGQALDEVRALLGEGDPRVRVFAADLEAAQTSEERRRQEAIVGWLDRAASGELAGRPRGLEEAVLGILQVVEPADASLLVERLDRVSQQLNAVERNALLMVQHAGPGESGGKLTGLEEAFARRLAGDATQADLELLEMAQERVERRAFRRLSLEGRSAPPGYHLLVAARQAEALGARLDEAKVCCRVLGRTTREAAEAPLARYLAAEAGERRALEPAFALLRLGVAEPVHDARSRFGSNGAFAKLVEIELVRAEVDEEELADDDARGHLERGEHRQAQGDHHGAVADFDVALRLDPKLVTAWVHRAISRSMLGNKQGALQDLDRALALDPSQGVIWHNRGQVKLELLDPEAALQDLNEAIEREPELGMAHTTRGLALMALKNVPQALESLRRGTELAPRSANAWLRLGMVEREAGDLDAAAGALERAIEVDPTYAPSHTQLGVVRQDQGRPDEALQALDRALELDPSQPQALSSRGRTRLMTGDVEGAMADCTEAIRLDSTYAVAYGFRAMAKARKGDLASALADMDRAVELLPDAQHLTNRGDMRRQAGDLDGALSDCTQALELEPELVPAYGNRALVHFTRGQFAAAEEDLRAALKLEPDNSLCWYNLGHVHRERGRRGDLEGWREALECYEQAVRLAPNFAPAYADRGLARGQLGDVQGAIPDLERFLKMRPHSTFAPQIRAALRDLKAMAAQKQP
jgi:tetratricopeptide (TPR) repeat protein